MGHEGCGEEGMKSLTNYNAEKSWPITVQRRAKGRGGVDLRDQRKRDERR